MQNKRRKHKTKSDLDHDPAREPYLGLFQGVCGHFHKIQNILSLFVLRNLWVEFESLCNLYYVKGILDFLLIFMMLFGLI
jgi:hypothetical protein